MAYFLTAVIATAITITTLMPNPPADPGLTGADKMFHALSFFLLVAPVAFWLPGRWRMILIGAVLFGALIELVQPYFGRGAELLDLLADGLGAGLGIYVAGWVQARVAAVKSRRA